jgi:hypothetical protein
MTVANPVQWNIRPPGHDAAMHLYTVGQTVRLKRGSRHQSQSTGLYRITGTLPAREDSPQYRIRNDAEGHERVLPQEALEPAHEGSALIERTFGHGKGRATEGPVFGAPS